MKQYNIAVYIRLSMADEDTGKGKSESDSIVNQRSLISRFLDHHPTLSQMPRTEFCDDGYTGTNTNRPAFTDMMKRVKKGEFDLICVKDFSRFSRDYIEIGDCLECLFPFLGVRFLSINDNYDSDDYKGTTGGLDVVMRNIVYAAYSKDLSVKTTTAKVQLMKQGKYVGNYAPYGYEMHPTIRNKLIVDPEAAAVVRKIFTLAIAGTNTSEIARQLNAEKIPTPAQYFVARHPDTKKFGNMSDKISWTHSMVHRTLNKLAYTGASVGHVRKIAAPLSRKTKLQSMEDWIVVEGVNEPIVSREEYDLAQAVMNKQPNRKKTQIMYPLKSLVRCGNCGRAMTRRKSSGKFYCSYGTYDEDSDCDSSKSYSEKELETLVYNAIQMFLQVVDTKKTPDGFRSKQKTAIREQVDLLSEIQKEAGRLRKQKLKLYEQYTSGELSKDAYLREKKSCDKKISEAEVQAAALEKQIAELEVLAEPETTEFEKTCASFQNADALSYELAHAFVDAVYVYPDGQREIAWKFKDISDSASENNEIRN